MSWLAEPSPRTSPRIDPGPAWTVVTDAPLKAMSFAREAGRVLACDAAGGLYLIDAQGQFLSVSRSPGPVVAAAISDDGSLVAMLGEGNRLWLLGADLETIEDREAVTDATAVAIDPHGQYVAVASRMNMVQFYSRFGKQAGRFETRQHLSHMAFVPSTPDLVGVGAYGSISCYELTTNASGKLGGELAWTHQLMSGVGRLATTGDGGMILVACFTHGVQRYDLRGRNEGAYHLGGSAAIAVPDFAGRTIAVASQEGELAILNGTGNVRWRTALARPAAALEVDALGRYLIYGLPTGEITRLDFQGGSDRADAPPAAVAARPGAGPVRAADWSVPVAKTDEHAESAVVAVIDDPPRIAVITPTNRAEILSLAGKSLGQAPDIQGVGRILRTCPGWVAAATDRQIVVCDLAGNSARRVDVNLHQMTHLVIEPDGFGLAIVQERDRIGRATLAGRWVWKAELNTPVEEIVIGPDGHCAIGTEDGRLRVYDPAGKVAGEYRVDPPEPLPIVRAPAGSPRGVQWLSLARRNQVIRGHDLAGRVVWEAPTPWEGFALHALGRLVLVTAIDGRAISYDGAGRAGARSGKTDGSLDVFYAGSSGDAHRVTKSGVHLISSDLDGRVAWRAIAEGPIGPMAAGESGVAAVFGRSLAWFGERAST
jgi:hypothetical protein